MDNKWLTFETKDSEVILKKCEKDAEGEIEVPSGTTIIYFFAFRICKGVTSVKLPDGLKVINNGAFEDCQKLSFRYQPLCGVHKCLCLFECQKQCEHRRRGCGGGRPEKDGRGHERQ